ncbi:RagB/SusD family nutrient uptake outer membrane protein [Mucilaginibacter panaciglaebae]|uniref:RagB/SusD family nutrient uptake outer membrane protein n=1 Tax=Mucilaginibacter panaciglaebae TaxID=502331 RepID=A0ABP7WKB1_9SPHI
MKKIIKISIIPFLLLIYLSGCKKLIEVNTPQNQLTTKVVFSDSTSAVSALVNIYALFSNTIDGTYNPNIALYSDELNFSNSTVQSLEFLHSTISTTNSTDLNIWKNYYFVIYSCNDLINQLSTNSQISPSMVKQLSSEAKFLRAYAYFYLTNLYGATPLILVTDINVSAVAPRSDTLIVYNQIIKDLLDAQSGLSVNYTGDGKVRANQLAATALLARIYLFQRNWANAETAASNVINSGLYSLDTPENVFLANSNESILQFQTQSGFVATSPTFIPISGKPQYPLTNNLLAAFEPGDLRLINWTKSNLVSNITYYYPYKYKNRTANPTAPECLMALRLGEQFLIRAEARVMQNNLSGAQADLNTIRNRAGLPNTTSNTQSTIENSILHERQVELFTEWGHRFFDLKRTGQANVVLGAYKSTWKPNRSLLFPIPQNDIIHDPNLKQNLGY